MPANEQAQLIAQNLKLQQQVRNIQMHEKKGIAIIRGLEAANAEKTAALREMRASKLSDYAQRSERNRQAAETADYLVFAALIVAGLMLVVFAGYWIFLKAVGVC